jgi:hypothetical protein
MHFKSSAITWSSVHAIHLVCGAMYHAQPEDAAFELTLSAAVKRHGIIPYGVRADLQLRLMHMPASPARNSVDIDEFGSTTAKALSSDLDVVLPGVNPIQGRTRSVQDS